MYVPLWQRQGARSALCPGAAWLYELRGTLQYYLAAAASLTLAFMGPLGGFFTRLDAFNDVLT